MEQQPIYIKCIFAEDGDIEQILHRSFSLYLDRELARDTAGTHSQHMEILPISGGR